MKSVNYIFRAPVAILVCLIFSVVGGVVFLCLSIFVNWDETISDFEDFHLEVLKLFLKTAGLYKGD